MSNSTIVTTSLAGQAADQGHPNNGTGDYRANGNCELNGMGRFVGCGRATVITTCRKVACRPVHTAGTHSRNLIANGAGDRWLP